MKDLIKIEEKDGKRLVDARELWKGLEIGRDFSTWVKAKIVGCVFFVENEDWVEVFPKSGENPKGGRPTKDYALTLDTAKKVAMAEQTEKGNVVRDYFLACEKLAQSKQLTTPSYQIDDRIRRAEAWILEEKKRIGLTKKVRLLDVENKQLNTYIENLEPKISYVESIMSDNKAMTVTAIGQDYDLSAVALNRILEAERIQYRIGGRWILYQNHKDKGYVKTKTKEIQHTGWVERRPYTVWTQLGRVLIHETLAKLGISSTNDKEAD